MFGLCLARIHHVIVDLCFRVHPFFLLVWTIGRELGKYEFNLWKREGKASLLMSGLQGFVLHRRQKQFSAGRSLVAQDKHVWEKMNKSEEVNWVETHTLSLSCWIFFGVHIPQAHTKWYMHPMLLKMHPLLILTTSWAWPSKPNSPIHWLHPCYFMIHPYLSLLHYFHLFFIFFFYFPYLFNAIFVNILDTFLMWKILWK